VCGVCVCGVCVCGVCVCVCGVCVCGVCVCVWCVCVALGIQHAMCMRYVDFCGLFRIYNISPHYLERHDFRQNVIEHKLCVLILSTTFVCIISHSEKNSAKCDYKCT